MAREHVRVAAAVIGGAALSAGVGAVASSSAANTQASAADNATQLQQNEFNQTESNLAPYIGLGTSAVNPLIQAMGYSDNNGTLSVNPNSPLQQQFSFNPTQQQLEQTPGYQFTQQQGQEALQNQMTSRGLGYSGAQVKGAANYVTGLADNTYQQQYQNALTNYTTNYNTASQNASRLGALVQTGQNSAVQQGTQGLAAAQNEGNLLTSGAAASAAGTVGTANAVTGAVNSGTSNYLLSQLLGGNTSLYGGAAGSENAGAAATSTPDDLISGYA